MAKFTFKILRDITQETQVEILADDINIAKEILLLKSCSDLEKLNWKSISVSDIEIENN